MIYYIVNTYFYNVVLSVNACLLAVLLISSFVSDLISDSSVSLSADDVSYNNRNYSQAGCFATCRLLNYHHNSTEKLADLHTGRAWE